MLNLSTLRNELGNLIKNTAISNTRKDRWLNLAQDDILTELDAEHLKTTFAFSTVASQRVYYVPFEFKKIQSVIDTTSNLDLTEITEAEAEEADPQRGQTGTSYNYYTSGLSWVSGQPSAASVITVVSSSASDTSQNVRISGLDANGTEITETINLDGVTPVAGTVSFTEIRQIAKDLVTTGYVTATSNSAAVTNVIIPADMLAKQYQPICLYPIPSGVVSVRVRGIRRPKMMVNAEDYPDFPEAYHELVLVGGSIRGHQDRFRPTLAKQVRDMYWTPMVKKLKSEMGNSRGKRSMVIGEGVGSTIGGRLPWNYPL